MINMCGHNKASEGGQYKLTITAIHEQLVVAFVLSLVVVEWICQCITQQLSFKKKSNGGRR